MRVGGPGLFVSFEGIEGSGKSTQAERLARALDGSGVRAVLVREPGGTPMAEAIRALLLDRSRDAPTALAEAFLFQAARADVVERVVRPARRADHVVIADRYTDASLAYQGAARGLGRDVIAGLNDLATGGERPDRTFVLDLPVEAALARVSRRTGVSLSRFDTEPRAFHERVREAYRALADADPGRIVVLDGERPPDDLAGEILRGVALLLEARRVTE